MNNSGYLSRPLMYAVLTMTAVGLVVTTATFLLLLRLHLPFFGAPLALLLLDLDMLLVLRILRRTKIAGNGEPSTGLVPYRWEKAVLTLVLFLIVAAPLAQLR